MLRHMITVPEAARRAGRNPETIGRGIREGKLRSQKVGTQHTIEEADLEAALGQDDEMLPLPPEWQLMSDGRPRPNVVIPGRTSGPRHPAAEVPATIGEQVYRNEVTEDVGTDALQPLAGLAISYEPAGRLAE